MNAIDTNYIRVMPRDLFNEANMLKCLGKLALLNLDGLTSVKVIHDTSETPGFVLGLDMDGGLVPVNLQFFTADDTPIYVWRPMNARGPWPLWAMHPDLHEDLQVFNDDGTLHQDWIDVFDSQ